MDTVMNSGMGEATAGPTRFIAVRRLIGGETGIGDARRLHQLVEPERKAHNYPATDDGIDGEPHTRAVDPSA
jgi:hypothetical protein